MNFYPYRGRGGNSFSHVQGGTQTVLRYSVVVTQEFEVLAILEWGGGGDKKFAPLTKKRGRGGGGGG